MPRRTYRKRKGRRTYRRRRRANNTNIQGFVSGMPKVRRARLRYADQIDLTSTAGSIDVFKMRANSVFDPNESGVGHQPMGFDQWALLYNHYVVVGAKISIAALASGSVTSAVCGVYLADDSSVPYSVPEGYIESKKGPYRNINIQRNAVKMTSNFSAKKFFNITDIKDNVVRIGADVGSNPTEPAVFHLWYHDYQGSTTTQTFQITVDYIVEFSEPKDLSQS